MEVVKDILRFFNFLDKDGNISITNITVFISTILFAHRPQAAEAATLLGSLLNYGHKRLVNAAYENDTDLGKRLNDLASDTAVEMLEMKKNLEADIGNVSATMSDIEKDLLRSHDSLQEKVKSIQDTHSLVSKQAEEVRAAIQAGNLTQSFNLSRRQK